MTNERNERRCVAFPEWMCRMNPFLRRADEDVLFLYFRERWSNALRRPWSEIAGLHLIGYLFALMILLVLFYFILKRFAIHLLITIFITSIMSGFSAKYLLYNGWRKRVYRQAVPPTLTAITKANGGDKELQKMLWLCGVRGGDIYRSLCFREAWADLLKIVLFLLLTWTSALAMLVGIIHFSPFNWFHQFLCLLIPMLTVALITQAASLALQSIGLRGSGLLMELEALIVAITSGYEEKSKIDLSKGPKIEPSMFRIEFVVSWILIGLVSTLLGVGAWILWRSTDVEDHPLLIAMLATGAVTLLTWMNVRFFRRRKLIWLRVARRHYRERRLMSKLWDLSVRAYCVQDPIWYRGEESFLENAWEEMSKNERQGVKAFILAR